MPRFARRDIFAAQKWYCDFAAVILYSPRSLRSKYNSAYAEYHCKAIKLAAGEYNWKALVLWTRVAFISVFDLTAHLFVICLASLGVIFLLHKSDIATSPQWYYIRPEACEANITRRMPNITAKQYNSPQANITEKHSFFEREVIL